MGWHLKPSASQLRHGDVFGIVELVELVELWKKMIGLDKKKIGHGNFDGPGLTILGHLHFL